MSLRRWVVCGLPLMTWLLLFSTGWFTPEGEFDAPKHHAVSAVLNAALNGTAAPKTIIVQHHVATVPLRVLLPWTTKYCSWFAGDLDPVALAKHGVQFRRLEDRDTGHGGAPRCIFHPRSSQGPSLWGDVDAVFIDSIGNMDGDRKAFASLALPPAARTARNRPRLGLWNSENWRGRRWEWSSKYRVRWLNLTDQDSFWSAFDTVVSFESTADTPFYYADALRRLEAQSAPFRRSLSSASVPATAMFVASNCFNRYDSPDGDPMPRAVKAVIDAARARAPNKVPRDREAFVKALQQAGLPVDSYGACISNQADVDAQCKEKHRKHAKLCTAAKHLFYLSFENSIYADYVTEKLYEPLAAGSIPIYLGAPNVAKFVPAANSIIRVADFGSVAELAAYMTCVARNATVRQTYLDWRSRPQLPSFASLVQQPTLARVCDALTRNSSRGVAPPRPSPAVDEALDRLQRPLPCS